MKNFFKLIAGGALVLGIINCKAATFTIHNQTGGDIKVMAYATDDTFKSPTPIERGYYIIPADGSRYVDGGLYDVQEIRWGEHNSDNYVNAANTYYKGTIYLNKLWTLGNVYLYPNGRYVVDFGLFAKGEGVAPEYKPATWTDLK